MPSARTVRGRLRQVELAVLAEFKSPLPVRVAFRPIVGPKGSHFASTHRIGALLHVAMWSGLLAWEAVARRMLFHELAHCLCWAKHLEGEINEQDHPDEWGLWVARLERWYYDGSGDLDSDEFSAAPWR